MDENYLIPHVFTRHKLHLHALLLQNQPWFCARDLGRLLRIYLNDRQLRKLDPDQYQTAKTLIHGHIENTLLISESGVYALLVYHYCPEYRALREWLTHEVVPALRDAQHPATTERPQPRNVVESAALEQPAVDSVAGCAADGDGARADKTHGKTVVEAGFTRLAVALNI
ncbi:hypothetical protein D3C76_727040 [compost metagenome]